MERKSSKLYEKEGSLLMVGDPEEEEVRGSGSWRGRKAPPGQGEGEVGRGHCLDVYGVEGAGQDGGDQAFCLGREGRMEGFGFVYFLTIILTTKLKRKIQCCLGSSI